MWLELTAAALLPVAGICAAGWIRTGRRLAESRREREDLANSSQVIEEERRMLELVAKGAPLNEVLSTLIRAIERISSGAICTVMLLDEEQRRFLSIAAGPSLPPAYRAALHGLEIGPDVGACGSAACLNETVVVEDISTDYRFAGAREFVLGHGLRSCWSQPICDSRNNVQGTFAMYHRYTARPRSEELRMARAAAQLAGNAIERIRAEKALKETSRRLSLAERVARFGTWEANFAKKTITISEGAAAMMEFPGDMREMTVEEFNTRIHPDDLDALQAVADPRNPQPGTIQNEFRLTLPSGAVRWVRSQWRFEMTDDPPTRATGAMIDITEEMNMVFQSQKARAAAEDSARAARQAEKLEQERKTILEMVAKDQPLDQIATTMAQAIASDLPGSLCSIQIQLPDASPICVYSGFSEQLAGALDCAAIHSIRETLSPTPIAKLSGDPAWQRFTENSGDFPFPYYRAVPILRNMCLTGMIVAFFAEDREDSQTDEKLLESWGQFASLAVERRGLYEQLSFRAQHDSLTTLLNRASLYDRLDAQICRASAEGGGMAVIYFDLDHFKEINDRYGHGSGDRVLQMASRRILENIRHSDIAARIGGDEFVAILPGVGDRREASRIAETVVKAIGQPDFHGAEVRVGASFGVSIYPGDGPTTDALLKMADEDMYRAKLKRRSYQPGRSVREKDPVSPVAAALVNA